MVVTTVVIQYSDGTSEEIQMSGLTANQLINLQADGKLPHILKIEYKQWLTDDDTLIPSTGSRP